MSVVEITNSEQLNTLRKSSSIVLFFWAEWNEPSKAGGQMHSVFSGLASKFADITFCTVNTDDYSDISESFQVTVVPTFVGLTIDGKVVGTVQGANPPELLKLTKQVVEKAKEASSSSSSSSSNERLQHRLKALVNSAPVMLFMKGSPSAPRCGFSRQIVEILQTHDIPFASFDILTDEDVRAGLKTFSDWPTYPQLYVGGEFSGGLDIVKEMVATAATAPSPSTSLKEQLGITNLQLPPPVPSLNDRLKALIATAPVMLFMKGTPEAPQCGFSRTAVQLLTDNKIPFSSFNILSDEEVRAGLKVYSDWPTYPQLYVNNTLVGGVDILKEMAAAVTPNTTLAEQLGLAE